MPHRAFHVILACAGLVLMPVTVSPHGGGIDRYTSNAHALPMNDFIGSSGGGGLWGNAHQWNWNSTTSTLC